MHCVTCSFANCVKNSPLCSGVFNHFFHFVPCRCDMSKLKMVKHVTKWHSNFTCFANPFLAAGARQRRIARRIKNLHACCLHLCSYIVWIIVTLFTTLSVLRLCRTFLPVSCVNAIYAVWRDIKRQPIYIAVKNVFSWDFALMLIWRNALTLVFSVPVGHSLDQTCCGRSCTHKSH